MTVVFSVASPAGVVVAADSAVTKDFGAVVEYDTGRKLWQIPGVGIVATWGARDGNNIGRHLQASWEHSDGKSASDLARSVHTYLVDEYRPDERGLGDVGYHVAGIYPDGRPALFHSYYQASANHEDRGHFDLQVIGPTAGTQFLYNGRNDIVHPYLTPILAEVSSGRDCKLKTGTLPNLAHLAHFILRTITEITPGVSAPFVIAGVSPDGREYRVKFDENRLDAAEFNALFSS